MDLVFLLILFSSFVPFIFCAVFRAIDYKVNLIGWIFVSGMVLFLIGAALFILSIRKLYKRLDNRHFTLSNKIKNAKGKKCFTFIYENRQWKLSDIQNAPVFDLHGYVFKKSFIIAFFVRAIRYPIISMQQKFDKLGNLYLKGHPQQLKVSIAFKKGKRYKNIIIAKNGKSRNTLLSWVITRTRMPYDLGLQNPHPFYSKLGKGIQSWIIRVDEEIFNDPYSIIK